MNRTEPLLVLVAVALAIALFVGCWLGRLRERRDLAKKALHGLPKQLDHEWYYLVALPDYRRWQNWKKAHQGEVEARLSR